MPKKNDNVLYWLVAQMYHKKPPTKSGMHTSIKIHYLKNDVPSQACVFRLQFKSVSTCFWVELKHIGETCGDSYLIGLSTQKKPNTLDKSSQPPVDQQRDRPFYICKCTHTCLCCVKYFIPEDWKGNIVLISVRPRRLPFTALCTLFL